MARPANALLVTRAGGEEEEEEEEEVEEVFMIHEGPLQHAVAMEAEKEAVGRMSSARRGRSRSDLIVEGAEV